MLEEEFKMLCALIMAGGKGTRFWPLSTEEKPKQFLNLIGEDTMIQMTVKRINKLIPMERIFVCTCEKYINLVKEQLPELDEKNIIMEPEGRNTAPCIALSALIIKRNFKNSKMIVLPSDHLIRNQKNFIKIIKDGSEFLENNKKAILTLGMTPTRPETGYGYIKCSNERSRLKDIDVIKVEAFVEKPNLDKAKNYLKIGSYLWNGGMFMWDTDNVLNQIKKYLPKTFEALHNLSDIKEERLKEFINTNYCKTDSISIDYGILEKSNDIFVIPSNIGWDDIGTWKAIDRYKEKDNTSNILNGNINIIDSEGNLVYAKEKDVVLIGVENLAVIENDDKLFIIKKEILEDIKEFRNKLEG